MASSPLFTQQRKPLLNPAFPRAYVALIGQMAQSVMIGLQLSACVGHQMSITISECQLQLPSALGKQ